MGGGSAIYFIESRYENSVIAKVSKMIKCPYSGCIVQVRPLAVLVFTLKAPRTDRGGHSVRPKISVFQSFRFLKSEN